MNSRIMERALESCRVDAFDMGKSVDSRPLERHRRAMPPPFMRGPRDSDGDGERWRADEALGSLHALCEKLASRRGMRGGRDLKEVKDMSLR